MRKISRIPFKVLDAPELQDDFYLNLVDWSAQNVLSVGLGSCVYLWNAFTSQVTRLCDLSSEGNSVTSVSWSERGSIVAVGTQKGHISVWDVAVNKEVMKLHGHAARVGALAWNGDILSSGSRDRFIRQRDTRTPQVNTSVRVLQGHRQEVCGLKWSPDGLSLASGGNDNKLLIWSLHSSSPMQTYSSHVAAVKAIAWSPHQHGLLASGGGTADRCIRFWNTLTSQPLHYVDTVTDMTVSKAYFLVFYAALFTTVRSTFFASGCFGAFCFSTPAPRPRARTNAGLRTLLPQNYDDTYSRSARPLTVNLKKRSLSLVPRARLDVPVVSYPNFRANLIGVEQIGPPQDQYVEFRPTTKEHRDVYNVLYPSGSSKCLF
ncbi:hypothetical protein MSG28_000104 [Choristoneura fumiferana]|uniref:Uncharacterized protein n=1 Tax=Choristoneura fumiferana TaxID=7141 RepID=A0ACC0JZB0_CHOFU|nr:hypothetical protein MSG28_000104 [Choristoneura fumiferana]